MFELSFFSLIQTSDAYEKSVSTAVVSYYSTLARAGHLKKFFPGKDKASTSRTTKSLVNTL